MIDPVKLAALQLFLLLSSLPPHTAAAEEGGARWVTRDGPRFVCGGEPFAAVGVNCYYLMVYAADGGLRGAVNEVLDDASALGATVVRTWAFNDGADRWNALQTSPGVYSEKVLAGLDYVVKRAGEKGLRLVLTLVNNWDDYGGMNQYVAWSPAAAVHDDFYTDLDARSWYKDHARKILTRVNSLTGVAYRDDPAILAWELANEPRADEKGAAVLNAWVAEMAGHLKSIDPRHLVSTGSEGFYGPGGAGKNPETWMSSRGVDFIASHSEPNIDYASFHAWPDPWSMSRAETLKWVADHLADARALGKPALLGEFGKHRPLSTRDDFFRGIYGALLDSLEPGAATAGSLLWMLYHDASPDYDGFGVYYPGLADASTTALIEESHRAIAARVSNAPSFIRGDATCDGRLGLSDAVRTLLVLFKGEGLACCAAAADANGDGETDVADAVYSLLFSFAGGAPPPAPFPACGAGAGCDAAAGACAGR